MLKNNKQLLIYPPIMALAIYATLLGIMIPQLQDIFGYNLTQIGLFTMLQGLGMVVSLILCFSVFSAFNVIKVSAISISVFAVLMVLIAFNTSAVVFGFLFFLIGLSQTTIDALSNTVISETTKHRISFYLSLMHSLWALAGAAGPFLAIALGGRYEVAFTWLGIFVAVSSLLFIIGLWQKLRMPMIQNRNNFGGILKLFKILKVKGMPSLALINMFSCLVQNTFIIFIATYVKDIFSFELSGAIVLSSLFFGFLIGRTIFSLLADKIPVMKIMAILNALAMAAFAGMLFSQSLVLTAVLIFAGSALTGMNFPALILKSHKIVPHDLSAASSLIYLGLAIAIFVASPLVGWMGDNLGLRTALLISSSGLVPIVILASVLSERLDRS